MAQKYNIASIRPGYILGSEWAPQNKEIEYTKS